MRPIVGGVGYGCALLYLSVMGAGGGHGTFVLAGLFGAPLTIFNTRLILLVPLFWAVTFSLADQRRAWATRGAIFAILAHYFGALVAWGGWLEPKYADWAWLAAHISKVLGLLIISAAVYSVGQVWLWRRIKARWPGPVCSS